MTHDAAGLRWFYFGFYLLAVAATIPFGRAEITYSALFGGAIAVGNLLYLERFLGTILSGKVGPHVARGMANFSFVFRFALIAFAFVQLIKAGMLHVPALFAGLSVTLVSIIAWFFVVGRHINVEEHERAY